MRTLPTIAVLGVLLSGPGSRAEAVEIRDGSTAVTVEKGGSGFLDSVRFRDRQVVKAKAGFVGGAVTLAPAGDGRAASLFTHRASAVLRAVIADVQTSKSAITASGHYTDGELRIPFTRQVSLVEGRNTIIVAEEADFTGLDPSRLLAKYALHLPLVLHKDPHLRMFGFGGANRAELFRMDMNDVHRRGEQLISASRGHRPYWDVAGVLQLPGGYRIWRANHADTMAYPIEEGAGAPGWADYSELAWGITAVVDDPQRAAPWAIVIDARKGVLSIAPHPGSQIAAAGRDLGKRAFRFKLILHETSWPATYPCELDFKLYELLLKDMVRGGNRPQPYVLSSPIGTADIPTIIYKERIQPSVILRTLYRGDAWRMRGRMKTIGRDGPRNQPMAKWEQEAKEYLEHLRKKGLPKPQGK